MSWTFHDKITDFVTYVATTACRQHDSFQKQLHHHCKQKLVGVATALDHSNQKLDCPTQE